MNELGSLVEFLATTLKQGITVAQDNIPAYVQQVLKYGEVRSSVGIFVGLMFLIASIYALVWVKKGYDKKNAEHLKKHMWNMDIDDWTLGTVVLVLSLVVMIVCVINIGINTSVLIKIKTAPIVYLIQQTRYLM